MNSVREFKVPLTKKMFFTLYGGPYREAPTNMVRVKMAKEIRMACEIDIPTDDFSTPALVDLTRGLVRVVDRIIDGETLFVGCWGGKGRTGLMLSIIAKAFGIKNPVEFVRANYYRHAVETDSQYAWITNYKVPAILKFKVKVARIVFWAQLKKGNLTEKIPAINCKTLDKTKYVS